MARPPEPEPEEDRDDARPEVDGLGAAGPEPSVGVDVQRDVDRQPRQPPIALSDRVVALGKTGSGKSEAIAHLWASSGRQRLLVDVNDAYELGPAAIEEGALEVDRVTDLDWRVRTIRYVPRGSQREYDDLYAAIFARGDLDVWLDEAYGPTTQHRAPEYLRRTVTQGRKRGIRHMATSQRPAMVLPELVDQAEHAFIFTLVNRDDLQTLSYRTGIDARTLSLELGRLPPVPGTNATGFLRHTLGAPTIVRLPPLPPAVIAATRRHVVPLS